MFNINDIVIYDTSIYIIWDIADDVEVAYLTKLSDCSKKATVSINKLIFLT